MEDFGAYSADGEAPKAKEGTATSRRPPSSVPAPLAKRLEDSARNDALFTADNNGAIDASTHSRSTDEQCIMCHDNKLRLIVKMFVVAQSFEAGA